MNKPFDVVAFGATSFVGQILAGELLQTFGRNGPLRWALAGRSLSRLETLRRSLGPQAADVPLIVADAGDPVALGALCAQARVVASTVGPYALYGSPLVQACAESGTDYVDLTGELQWIRRMLQQHEATAQRSGARIVHCCGFDSIPSDLGVLHLQTQARQRFGAPCPRVKMRVKAMKGAASGGTVASMLNLVKEARANPALRRELGDPYSLCPGLGGRPKRQPDVRGPQYDDAIGAWVAPFVMGAINTRVVQRTNALAGLAYGRDFAYDEAVISGKGLKGRAAAMAMTAGLGAFMLAGAIGPLRVALERFVLPKPGEGPSAEVQRKGHYDLRFVGLTADGRRLRTRVTGDRDPGYGSTARMLAQAAACLAQDIDPGVTGGGFWTPATAFGERLIDRLQAHAGLRFEVLDDAA